MPVVLAPVAPWLAGAIGGLLTGLIGWVAKFFTRKVANYVVYSGAIFTLTAAYYAAGYAAISGLMGYAPPYASTALALVLPDNVGICLSAMATARTARWVYVWNFRWIMTNAAP